MSAQTCLRAACEEERSVPYTNGIATQIDELLQERLRDWAEQPLTKQPTEIERNVDELLDSLTNLHRLEQLAAHAARGGKINVEADRIFIAQNEAAYRRLLERYAAQQPARTVITNTLLPAYPRPIE